MITASSNEPLKRIAEKVLDKVPNKDPEKFGSVMAILMIISIILTVIRVIQECNKNKIKLFNRRQKKWVLWSRNQESKFK